MREVQFIRQNKDKWKQYENLLRNREEASPEELANQFVRITDDLAYSRTFFPESATTRYINTLAALSHQQIYQNKREPLGRIWDFWRYEFPLMFRPHLPKLGYSFLIFAVAVAIGAYSAGADDRFVRLILGDGYVNMTLENIEKGDPMAVYKDAHQMDMFLGITINNIRVAMICFVFGAFFSVGTGYILFANGVMVGAFQYFFYQKGLLLESAKTIWVHGTIEISVIIAAGAAGMMLGNSILFPGTYRRIDSFMIGVRAGLKVLIATVPFFVVAGALEGFVTRYTGMPLWLNMFIIFGSLGLIVFYFIGHYEKLPTFFTRKKNGKRAFSK